MFKKTELGIFIGLCLVTLVFFVQRNLQAERKVDFQVQALPLVISGFKAQELTSTELEKYHFTKQEYLTRLYQRGNQTIWMHVVAPQSRLNWQHYPLGCLAGSGSVIKRKSAVQLLLHGKQINAYMVETNQSVLVFWFSDGVKTWGESTPRFSVEYYLKPNWRNIKYMLETRIQKDAATARNLLQEFLEALPPEYLI